MSWVAVGVAVGGLVLQAQGQRQAKKASEKQAALEAEAGAARKRAAEFEANVLDSQASQAIALAQRDMLDARRAGELASSRAIALAAASGGGATAPTVTRIVGDITKEASYNSMRALYAGEERARLMRLQARNLREQGEFAQTQGLLAAGAAESRARSQELATYATLVQGAGGLYAKYAGGGFQGGGGSLSSGANLGTGGAGEVGANYA